MRVPEYRLIADITNRWRHDKLGTFKVRFFRVSLIKDEVGDDRFNPDIHSPVTSFLGRPNRTVAAGVNDVNMGTCQFGECHQMMHAFGFHDFRTRRFVILGAGLARRQSIVVAIERRRCIFAVGSDDDAQLFGQFECVEQFFIIDPKRPRISQKDLE